MVMAKTDERTAFRDTNGILGPVRGRSVAPEDLRIPAPRAIRLARHHLGNTEGVRASYHSTADSLATVR
jgi:hypothetical protein